MERPISRPPTPAARISDLREHVSRLRGEVASAVADALPACDPGPIARVRARVEGVRREVLVFQHENPDSAPEAEAILGNFRPILKDLGAAQLALKIRNLPDPRRLDE